jgi:integrase/recombinase XerD
MTRLTLKELDRDIQDFLKFKRAMGYSYIRGEFMLASLKRFARHQLPAASVRKAKISLEKTAHAWLSRTENRKGNTVAQELTVVRQLCLHRRRRDPHGFVPEQAWAPKTELPFLPYIFSRQEVRRLLIAAGRYRRRNVGPVLMRTLLLILYCTGLRFGEAVRLRLSDVNLERRTFFIRESKGRSRIVAFGDDLADEIKRWLVERDRIVSTQETQDPGTLLLRRNGRAFSLKVAGNAVTWLVRNEGLKAPLKGEAGCCFCEPRRDKASFGRIRGYFFCPFNAPENTRTSEEFLFSGNYRTTEGIYTPHRAVVKTGDVIDGITLTGFGGPYASSRRGLAFEATYGPASDFQAAIFTRKSVIVKNGQTVAGEQLQVSLAFDVNDEDQVVYSALFNGGVYPNDVAIATKDEIIVAVGDTIDGRTITALGAPVLNDAGVVAFLATFSDGSQAIVKAIRKWKG